MADAVYYATGRRKTSVARVWLKPGKGEIKVNKKEFNNYFPMESTRINIKQPLVLTSTEDRFDVMANVSGGGTTGQAEAVRHGIAKALVSTDPELRKPLKKAGFITRDPRAKERKKYGQKGARARFQYSKR